MEYCRDLSASDFIDSEMKNELLKEIESVILELDVAHKNYEAASKELVDYYAYKIKAEQSKYDYLLRVMKKFNITRNKKIV